LHAILQTECLATPTHEASAQEVEVGEEVEDVADWCFDKRDEMLFHGDTPKDV
jgi:hypothetical protein